MLLRNSPFILPLALFFACSSPSESPTDAGAVADSGAVDGGTDGTVAPTDSGSSDATADTASSDSGLASDALADAVATDAGAVSDTGTDSGPLDAGVPMPDLYDQAIVPSFAITIDAAAQAVLSSSAPADQKTWVHGSFTYNGVTFADVGIRQKGSSTFRPLPGKSSLKIKFDKWVAGQKLLGLGDLTLNNMVADETGLSERLGYYFYRAMGLPAQRANNARLSINGANYGLYANVETPNKDFIKRVFGADYKSLYEVNYGLWMPNEGDYQEQVGDGTGADLQAFFANVSATPDSALPGGVSGKLNVTEWMKFASIEALTGNRDGYAYGVFGAHNYYLASNQAGVFSLIPWSQDLLWENNPPVNAALPLPANPDTGALTLLGRCKNNAACWATYKTQVRATSQAFVAADLGTLARTWHNQIDTYMRNDPKRESTLGTYDAETANLYAWIAARPGIVNAQVP